MFGVGCTMGEKEKEGVSVCVDMKRSVCGVLQEDAAKGMSTDCRSSSLFKDLCYVLIQFR